MTTPSLDIRAGCSRRRRAQLLGSGASVVALVMLAGCTGGGRPEPLVAGGHLTAGLAALAPGAQFSADLWIAPTLGPIDLRVEVPDTPLPAFRPTLPAPRPPPPKPTFELPVA